MLDEALLKLEQVIDQLIDKNQVLGEQLEQLTAERNQLSQKLQHLEEDNENLQLEGIEQEDKQQQTLVRIQSMLERVQASSVVHNADTSSHSEH
ncbi:MAG: hypothetical protein ACPG4U_06810 [Pseudomonadales bacterium]